MLLLTATAEATTATSSLQQELQYSNITHQLQKQQQIISIGAAVVAAVAAVAAVVVAAVVAVVAVFAVVVVAVVAAVVAVPKTSWS